MEEKKRGGEGRKCGDAGRGKLENREGREAWPHPHKILIRHCNDSARVGPIPHIS